MGELTRLVTYLGIFGIPSIFTMTLYCIKQCNKYTKQLVILMRAQKAQMRAKLLEDFRVYEARGYITDMEAQEWQNQYLAYHELVGENGILDAKYTTIQNMPNVPPVQHSQGSSGN